MSTRRALFKALAAVGLSALLPKIEAHELKRETTLLLVMRDRLSVDQMDKFTAAARAALPDQRVAVVCGNVDVYQIDGVPTVLPEYYTTSSPVTFKPMTEAERAEFREKFWEAHQGAMPRAEIRSIKGA